MEKQCVSVVIPAYNCEDKIIASVMSAFRQPECGEVVVVDDGSKDNTVDTLKTIKDDRLKVLVQKNSGACIARNTGIEAALLPYIALLDADDEFLDGHLTRALKSIHTHGSDGAYAKVIVERGDGVNFTKPPRGLNKRENISNYLLSDRGFVPTCSLVLTSKAAKSTLYTPNLKGGQDTDFAIRLYHEGFRLSFVDEPGAIWNDFIDENRVSAKIDVNNRINWLESNKDKVSKKAYLADYGWYISKALARNGNRSKAAYYYARALLNFCYSPKLSIVVFLQVFLSPMSYRRLSDKLAAMGVNP